jgi:osmotically-inducible protein OsmY
MRINRFAALALAFGLLAMPLRAADPTPKEQEIQALLLEKGGEDARGVRVTVDGKTAILTGEVPSRAMQEISEEIVLSVDGIKKVKNRLAIAGGVEDTRDKLTRETADARLESAVKRRLFSELGKRAGQIEVEAVDDVVSLRGTLPDESRKQIALDTVAKTTGVKQVVDLLKVKQ